MDELILDAITKANRLGAQDIAVVGYVEPQTVIQDPRWLLITQIPPKQNADELAWHER